MSSSAKRTLSSSARRIEAASRDPSNLTSDEEGPDNPVAVSTAASASAATSYSMPTFSAATSPSTNANAKQTMQWFEPKLTSPTSMNTPTIKNHSVTHYDNHLFCFGGYDGRRNHQTLSIYSIATQSWTLPPTPAGCPPPPGRNGHTATLDTERHTICIIGGWLGSGPLAAHDTYVLDVSQYSGSGLLSWHQPPVRGVAPGPCNMHSADYIPSRSEIWVFRGGNGKDYLNDLHALHTVSYTWRVVTTTGSKPQKRANHCSAVIQNPTSGVHELIVFGGWNGRERLNDVHILNTETCVWTSPRGPRGVGGVLPHPRAGMTLTCVRNRLYLFGGSGTSSKCFNDLQILDRESLCWLDVAAPVTHGSGSETKSREEEEVVTVNDAVARSHSVESLSLSLGESTLDRRFDRASSFPRSRSEGATGSLFARFGDRDRHTNSLAPHNSIHNNHTPTISLLGHGPGKRAGHTATAVNRHIYIFGGSCGSDYLNDFYVLDTDPPPRVDVDTLVHPTSLQLLEHRLEGFCNNEEFSDVTFLVEGRQVFGHKMILCLVSDTFRAMFQHGWKERDSSEIAIPECSYRAFCTMMQYLYTGRLPHIAIDEDTSTQADINEDGNDYHRTRSDHAVHSMRATNGQDATEYSTACLSISTRDDDNDQSGDHSRTPLYEPHATCITAPTKSHTTSNFERIEQVIELLELADQFFLDHLKQVCERLLRPTVSIETYDYLLGVAQKTNATQLEEVCRHFQRNYVEVEVEVDVEMEVDTSASVGEGTKAAATTVKRSPSIRDPEPIPSNTTAQENTTAITAILREDHV